MSRSINDCNEELASLKLPQSDINGDTTLTLSLKLVQDPSILEGSLAHLTGLLLELLNGTLVNTTAFVDEMTSGRGLARVDMADHDDGDMNLFFTHGD